MDVVDVDKLLDNENNSNEDVIETFTNKHLFRNSLFMNIQYLKYLCTDKPSFFPFDKLVEIKWNDPQHCNGPFSQQYKTFLEKYFDDTSNEEYYDEEFDGLLYIVITEDDKSAMVKFISFDALKYTITST
jgi:hypothetical protein